MIDNTLTIAIGRSASSKMWKNTEILWSDLAARLTTEHKTNETFEEYKAATKADRGLIKDVGGFVGGVTRDGKRKKDSILCRTVITLDLDFATLDFWDHFKETYTCSAVLHSTHSHSEKEPRYRLIIPLEDEITPDEYEPTARMIAFHLGIDLFDDTTFEINRLMFWPSTSSNVDFYSRVQEGPFLDADEILGDYTDWTDASSWPVSSRVGERIRNEVKQQEDPLTKAGLVGAFCRTYNIHEAIAKFIPNEYTPTDEMDRYTYAKGTTSKGVVIYDDLHSFSHHGTDPASGQLCNAFDLIRLHKFGHLDAANSSKKSTAKMYDLIDNDEPTKALNAKERIYIAFEDDLEEEDPLSWSSALETDAKGKFLATEANIKIIVESDPNLKGLFKQDIFAKKKHLTKAPPWRGLDETEDLIDVDHAGLRAYIGTTYGITAIGKIADALDLECQKQKYHPVRDYLNSLKWDKVNRIDTFLNEYFGVVQDQYSAEAMRMFTVGAVARIFEPGIKFDLVLTLVGKGGTGKSTFARKMGKDWASDSLGDLRNKDVLEQIQGSWIIEMAELSGYNKADKETAKHFISKQDDKYRAAYARETETIKRQCVFIATTNTKDFLTDPDGNRRFMPFEVDVEKAKKSTIDDLDDKEVDQIWAEALTLYRAGTPLVLSAEANALADGAREEHTQDDGREGLIRSFLDMKLPEGWDKMGLDIRRDHLANDYESGTDERQRVCVMEISCEALDNRREQKNHFDNKFINEFMRKQPDWKASKGLSTFGIYGRQRFYTKN